MEPNEEQIKELQEKLSKMSPEELKEFQKSQCIFCQIISNKIPSKVIYDDNICMAILDINPAGKGHVLLLPKEHYQVGPQVHDEIMNHLGIITKNISRACFKGLKCSGTNIFMANGAIAGQKAQHFMIHIVPRFDDDGINTFKLNRSKIDENELQSLAKNLKEYIDKILHAKIIEHPKNEEPKINGNSDLVKPKKEKGYLYFLDSEGDISRVRMKKKDEQKIPSEKILKLGVTRQSGLLYYIDKDLNVKTKPMNRAGRQKGTKNKRKVNTKLIAKLKKNKKNKTKKESKNNNNNDLKKIKETENKSISLDDIAELFTK